MLCCGGVRIMFSPIQVVIDGASGGSRTLKTEARQILSLMCIPFHHTRSCSVVDLAQRALTQVEAISDSTNAHLRVDDTISDLASDPVVSRSLFSSSDESEGHLGSGLHDVSNTSCKCGKRHGMIDLYGPRYYYTGIRDRGIASFIQRMNSARIAAQRCSSSGNS